MTTAVRVPAPQRDVLLAVRDGMVVQTHRPRAPIEYRPEGRVGRRYGKRSVDALLDKGWLRLTPVPAGAAESYWRNRTGVLELTPAGREVLRTLGS